MSVPVTVAAALGGHPVAGPRDDLAAARDDRRGVADGDGRLLAAGHGDLGRRGGGARRRLQHDGGRPRRRRPAAPAARGDGLARAAHPARRPAGAAREPRRRRRASRRRRAARPRWPRPSGSATLVGDLLDLSRVDGGRAPLALAEVDVRALVERAVAEAGVSRRGTVHVVDVPADLTSPPTRPVSPRSSPTWSTTPTGTARRAGA